MLVHSQWRSSKINQPFITQTNDNQKIIKSFFKSSFWKDFLDFHMKQLFLESFARKMSFKKGISCTIHIMYNTYHVQYISCTIHIWVFGQNYWICHEQFTTVPFTHNYHQKLTMILIINDNINISKNYFVLAAIKASHENFIEGVP